MIARLRLKGLGEVKLNTEYIRHFSLDDTIEKLEKIKQDKSDDRVILSGKGNRHDFKIHLPIKPFIDYFDLEILPDIKDVRSILMKCLDTG
jgi:hypothetical protein